MQMICLVFSAGKTAMIFLDFSDFFLDFSDFFFRFFGCF